jgi:hypothetical protein
MIYAKMAVPALPRYVLFRGGVETKKTGPGIGVFDTLHKFRFLITVVKAMRSGGDQATAPGGGACSGCASEMAELRVRADDLVLT